MTVQEMTAPPRLPVVLARGALGSLGKRGPYGEARLPETRLVLPSARVDSDQLRAYIRVCGFPDGVSRPLPPSFPHVLAFPLAMRLMTGPDFPFPLLGLVHTGIDLTQHKALRADDRPELTVYAEGLEEHRRGSQFAMVTEARVGGELVWSSRSTYLCRHRTGKGDSESDTRAKGKAKDTSEGADGLGGKGGERGAGESPLPALAEWRLPGSLGRRYAAASGDRNPIHLHPLTAKLFGFRRHIAHGMWTFARCLAQHGSTGTGTPAAKAERISVRAQFKAPVTLPRTVTYRERGEVFQLRGGREGDRLHLTGEVTSGLLSAGSPGRSSRSS
jgi:hypothetical protein